MKKRYVEPGVYDIGQKTALSGICVKLDKLIVHEDSFALILCSDPQIQLCCPEIRKNFYNIIIRHLTMYIGTACSTVAMIYKELPPCPFDVIFSASGNSKQKIRFRVSKLSPLSEHSDIYRHDIPIHLYQELDSGKRIYIDHITTGHPTSDFSYSILRGDFHEIKPLLNKIGPPQALLLNADVANQPETYLFLYVQAIRAFQSRSFLPKNLHITGCQLFNPSEPDSGL
jgi:hypothetical protein